MVIAAVVVAAAPASTWQTWRRGAPGSGWGPAARRAKVVVAASLVAALGGCASGGPEPAVARCQVAAPALSTGHLHTDGTRLRDALDRVVLLRGVNAGSRAKWAPYAPFDFDGTDAGYDQALARYLDGAAALGIDVVRAPLLWAALEPTRGQDDEAYLVRYGKLVDEAWKRGIRTIVDAHQDVYAEAFCGDGFPPWTLPGTPSAPHHDCPRWFEAYSSPQVMNAFAAFWAPPDPPATSTMGDFQAMWERVVARWKDRPGVVGFEPLNEPSAGGLASDADFEANLLHQFFVVMANRIHVKAPEALVFVDPVGSQSTTLSTSLGAIAVPGVVYAPHYYQPVTIFGGTGRTDLILDNLTKMIAPAQAWGVPALLGEWGAGQDAPEAAEYVGAHHDAFDKLGLMATQWEYSVSSEVWNSEPLGLARADGTFRPMADEIRRRPRARAVAGTPLEVGWDGTTYTLRYVPSRVTGDAAVSEIWRSPDAGLAVTAVEGACVDEDPAGPVRVRATGSGVVTVRLQAQ